MKRSTIIRVYCCIFCLSMLTLPGATAFGQQTQGPESTPANDSVQLATTDTLPESAYELKVPAHSAATFYTLHMAGILFTILIILMAYVSYRYWNDNRTKRDAADSAES